MSPCNADRLYPYMVLMTPEEANDIAPGRPGYDPDLHCPKYRVISVQMQLDAIEADKKHHGLFLEEEPVSEPQKRAVMMIPTLDLIPPHKYWFDSDKDAETFIKAVARVSDVSVHIVGRTSTGGRLYQFLNKVADYRYVREEKEEGSPPLSLQERRRKHWCAVIKEAPLARDFSPELVSHITLMLVCASRALSDDKKGLFRSTDLSNKLEKLQIWFEENDKAALDEFDALHYRDPNHPNHFPEKLHAMFNASYKKENKNNNKNRGKARNQGTGGARRRKAHALPPGVSARGKRQHRPLQPPQLKPLSHPHPDRQTELPKRSREGRRYHQY